MIPINTSSSVQHIPCSEIYPHFISLLPQKKDDGTRVFQIELKNSSTSQFGQVFDRIRALMVVPVSLHPFTRPDVSDRMLVVAEACQMTVGQLRQQTASLSLEDGLSFLFDDVEKQNVRRAIEQTTSHAGKPLPETLAEVSTDFFDYNLEAGITPDDVVLIRRLLRQIGRELRYKYTQDRLQQMPKREVPNPAPYMGDPCTGCGSFTISMATGICATCGNRSPHAKV